MFRELYEVTKKERDDAQAALALENENSTSLGKSYASAEREIATLNRALDRYAAAVALYEKAVGQIEAQRDQARTDAKRARKRAALATAALAAITFFLAF